MNKIALLGLLIIILFLNVDYVVAQNDNTRVLIDENIPAATTNIIVMTNITSVDNITINLDIPVGFAIDINIYEGDVVGTNAIVSYGNIDGNYTFWFIAGVTAHLALCLYNRDLSSLITVMGWWAKNYNATENTTTTTTTTKKQTSLSPVVAYIVMALPLVLLIIVIIWLYRKRRSERHPYLLKFEDKELFPKGHTFD